MADPAPSTPLPAGPESRVSPADQMAALTGEPVELSQPEADEPAEDRDASTAGKSTLSRRWRPSRELLQPSRLRRMTQRNTRPAQLPNSAETPVSPPAPREPVSPPEPPRAPDATPPDPSAPAGVKPQQGQSSPVAPSSAKAQDHPNEASRSPQGAAPLNATAMVAAALTGGLRRPEPPAAALPPRFPRLQLPTP